MTALCEDGLLPPGFGDHTEELDELCQTLMDTRPILEQASKDAAKWREWDEQKEKQWRQPNGSRRDKRH